MERTRTALESPVTAGSLTLVPVTRTTAAAWHYGESPYFSGMKRLLFILVLDSAAGVKAFRISGEPVSLEDIVEECPELKDSLKKYFP